MVKFVFVSVQANPILDDMPFIYLRFVFVFFSSLCSFLSKVMKLSLFKDGGLLLFSLPQCSARGFRTFDQ